MKSCAQNQQDRLESRKIVETEERKLTENNTLRKSSIASIVKDSASERARAQILLILKEAIHKMELENKSHLLRKTEDTVNSEKETVELVNTSTRRKSIRSRTVQPSYKKPQRQRNRCSSRTSTQTSVSNSTTLTVSALKTPRPRANSTECRTTPSQRKKNLESSIASLQTDNTALENQLRKLEKQLIIERQERIELESRLETIEKLAGINSKVIPNSAEGHFDEVPRNSPSEDSIVPRNLLKEN